jgi:carbohydrate-selective porin OprB
MRALLFLAAALPAALSAADTIPQLSEQPGLLEGDHALGDLGGFRSGFAEHGLVLDAWAMADGAYHSRDPGDGKRAYGNYLVEVGAELDTNTFLGILPGGTVHVAWQRFDGEAGSAALGTLQPASWLDAGARTQFARLWYEQVLFDVLAIKVGKEDVSYDFASNAFGQRFLDSSPVFEPTILGMPTYPDPATGARIALTIDTWVVRVGAYDGRAASTGYATGKAGLRLPDGDVFSIAEAGYELGQRKGPHLGGIVVGAWQHSGGFARFDGSTQDGLRGWYLRADGRLWSDPASFNLRALKGFVQLGATDDAVAAVARHVGLGLELTGPWRERPRDVLLAMMSWAGTSRVAGAPYDSNETVFEAGYVFNACNWLQLTPDLQWFQNPGGLSGTADVYAGSLRGMLTF